MSHDYRPSQRSFLQRQKVRSICTASMSTCVMTSAQPTVPVSKLSACLHLDLDLWLDIKQHTSLCRVYVRELRRSVLVATPDFEKETEHHRLTPENDPYSGYDDDEQENLSQYRDRPPHAGGGQIGDHNISPFLRSQSQMGFHHQQQQLSGSRTPPSERNYPTALRD